jgi:hypothetical protein
MRSRRQGFAIVGLALLAMIGAQISARGQAPDAASVVADLPRAFVGEFRWDGDRAIQTLAIRFNTVRRLDAGHVGATGCGVYETEGRSTAIDVRMQVSLPGLAVEIWERAPDQPAFVTDGSHRGSLSGDLHSIEARWTTTATGQQGELRLQAAPAARCAPASAT